MKKYISCAVGLLALLAVYALPGYAGGYHGSGNYHGNSGHGNSYSFGFAISPGWGGWGPGWWGPPAYPYYPYYPYYAAPPVVLQQQPQAYVQQRDQGESDYWYYCQSPQGYYPYIKSCPGGWMKVVPEPAPPQ